MPLKPTSRIFGYDRGLPIDRFYIEKFLSDHRQLIRGCVLEVADSEYIDKFGAEKVTQKDILHVDERNPKATVIGNLESGRGIPGSKYDCFIMTQTLHLTYDIRSVLKNSLKLLKPGGHLLFTVPVITQISRYDMDNWGDYWRFTDFSVKRLCEEFVSADNVLIHKYGNAKAASAFLYGITCNEVTVSQLEYYDDDYQMLLGIALKKPDTTF